MVVESEVGGGEVWTESTVRIFCPNGPSCIFAGLDPAGSLQGLECVLEGRGSRTCSRDLLPTDP